MLKLIVPVAGFVLVAGAAHALPPIEVFLGLDQFVVTPGAGGDSTIVNLPGATSVEIFDDGTIVGTVDPSGAGTGTIDSSEGPPPVTETPGGTTPGP